MTQYGKGFNADEDKERRPPTMTRSMQQLATVYAPGALFTWEGGLGACRSLAVSTTALELAVATRDLIREQIQEHLESWIVRGQAGSYPIGNEPNINQLVDKRILCDDRPQVTNDKLVFVSAKKIGYEPFPLTFVCRRCDLYRASRDVATLVFDKERFSEECPSRKAGKPCQENWEQLDVVMMHWSGAVEPISPVRRWWDANEKKLASSSSCRGCEGKNFKLLRISRQFSKWRFECVNCGRLRDLRQSDEFTCQLLSEYSNTSRISSNDTKMEPVSYTASSVYYAQSDRVLVFKESKWLNLLQMSRALNLKTFLGSYYGYPGKDLTDGEKQELLRAKGLIAEWHAREDLCKTAETLLKTLPKEVRRTLDTVIAQYDERWAKEVFTSVERGSDKLGVLCSARSRLIRRYDPIRMAVEHRTLSAEKLMSTSKVDGKDACVDVTVPDQFLLPESAEREAIITKVKFMLEFLGIAEMRLIRDLEVCEFSFGYTRVSSSPTLKRNRKVSDQDMPVRLNMFDKITSQERVGFPVYCLQQANEAFYVRLDEATVRAWMERNGMSVDAACPSDRLGGLLIEGYKPFDRFLDQYRRDKTVARDAYPYAYTLLHTMAHQLIGVMSELSGLDLGSFGEHLFVPDLAFMVYRRGMTMDLGNLSSMWRNHGDPEHGNEVLHKMAMPETLRCGAETICMTLRGGACPDCILIPENACLTRNELLSRSVLIGRGTPQWDQDERELVGFYDIARERAAH